MGGGRWAYVSTSWMYEMTLWIGSRVYALADRLKEAGRESFLGGLCNREIVGEKCRAAGRAWWLIYQVKDGLEVGRKVLCISPDRGTMIPTSIFQYHVRGVYT